MKRRMSQYSQLGQFLNAKFPTAILKCPTAQPRYTLVGSVPAALHTRQDGTRYFWSTEQGAIDALLAIGITEFQRADCSWYGR